jgi:hypothetical protein
MMMLRVLPLKEEGRGRGMLGEENLVSLFLVPDPPMLKVRCAP